MIDRLALIACCLAGAAGAVTIEVGETPLRIPPQQSAALEFGTVPQQDTTVLLTIQCRVDSPGLGGSNLFMGLELNGQPIRAARSRTVVRLKNKPLISPVAPNLPSTWFDSSLWRVLYAPDFEAALAADYYVGDPYVYVLDITDLTNPAAENRLTITNDASPALAQRLNASLDLVLGQLTIETLPEPSPTMGAADAVKPVINRGEPGAGPADYGYRILPAGALEVTVGGRPVRFESRFSYPNAGFNSLAAEPAGGQQDGWQVTLEGDSTVRAEGPHYSLLRRIQRTRGFLMVEDSITNKGAEPLGLAVDHAMSLAGLDSPSVRLAGNGDPAINQTYAPPNPSVHVTVGEQALGMIAEDDILRAQSWQYVDSEAETAGLRDEMLCLQPNETVTLAWSIHPVASTDYYDFINLVRAAWGSNYPTEGAWMFFAPDQILNFELADLSGRIERLGIRYACSWGGWVDGKADIKRIGFGTEVASDYWADYRRRLKEATAKLHEASPGIKVLIYYDTQRDTYADAGERYPDSKLTNARGEHLSTDWSKVYSLTWSMIATAENSFGRALLDVIDVCMDEIGADGLYWDEMENVGYGAPLLTYDQTDGHSAILNLTTYTIERQVGLTTLLGEGHRLAVIDKVRAKGGTLMGNGPTTTKELLARQVQRMVEIQHNDYWAHQGNLDTPLGYGSSPLEFSNITRALSMATLVVGTRTDYPHDISRYLFPFTPIELHHGYLLGQERIITMHSGAYGWPGETVPVIVRRFDGTGKLVAEEQAVAGPERLAVEVGEGEVVVLERAGS